MCSAAPRCHAVATDEAVVWCDISLLGCLCRGPSPLVKSYNTDAPATHRHQTCACDGDLQLSDMQSHFVWPLFGRMNEVVLQTTLQSYISHSFPLFLFIQVMVPAGSCPRTPFPTKRLTAGNLSSCANEMISWKEKTLLYSHNTTRWR